MLIKKIKNKSRHRHDAKGTSDTGSEKLRMRRTRSIAAVVLNLGGITWFVLRTLRARDIYNRRSCEGLEI
jgi:hypothetical protein